MLRILREYQASSRDSAAQIDAGRVPVLNRPSPVETRPVGMGTRSAAVAALHAAEIRSADPTTGVFQPCLGFPSARVATMAVGATGSSREMEPPPGFASTPIDALMPWGQPRPAAPNGAPPVAPRPSADHMLAGSRFLRQRPFFDSRSGAMSSDCCFGSASPRFGVRPPAPHAVAGARPPPPTDPLALRPIEVLFPFLIGLMSM
jgi:hypothetical protein